MRKFTIFSISIALILTHSILCVASDSRDEEKDAGRKWHPTAPPSTSRLRDESKDDDMSGADFAAALASEFGGYGVRREADESKAPAGHGTHLKRPATRHGSRLTRRGHFTEAELEKVQALLAAQRKKKDDHK